MEETLGFVRESILPHWPFLLGYVGLYFTGQFVKAQVWTKERVATPGKGQKFFHFMRRTMAVHAPIAGFLLGLLPGIPASPGVEGVWHVALYWSAAGLLSSFTFHAASEWVRKKTKGGVDIEQAIENAVNPSMRPSPTPGEPEEE